MDENDDNMIDGTAERIENDRPLSRRNMAQPGAMERFQEKGLIGQQEIGMSSAWGGPRFDNMLQVMEFAKLMATADIAVRAHLRGNPGACLAVTLKAQAWGFEPFFVAEKSYAVRAKNGDITIAYESQLLHAVIERRAPLEERLRFEYKGEGDDLICTVIGKVIGESKPREWESPKIGAIKVKNSPEWFNNPKKQLFYHTSRDWARIYFPDVLGGVYAREEMQELTPRELQESRTQAPTVLDRLSSRKPETDEEQEGFDQTAIQATLAASRNEAPGTAATKEPTAEKPASEPTKTAEKPPRETKAKEQPTPEPQPEQPQPDPESKPARVEPVDGPTYAAFADEWIGRTAAGKISPDDAEARWDGEREMRAKCKVTVTERKRLEKDLKAACAKARGGNNAES